MLIPLSLSSLPRLLHSNHDLGERSGFDIYDAARTCDISRWTMSTLIRNCTPPREILGQRLGVVWLICVSADEPYMHVYIVRWGFTKVDNKPYSRRKQLEVFYHQMLHIDIKDDSFSHTIWPVFL